jgi:uncharacterized membrane protein
MINLELSIIVNCPVEEVFDYMSDSRNELHWSAGVADIQQTPEGLMNKCTVITEARNFMGRRIESRSEIVEYEPNKKFVRKGIDGPFPVEGSLFFAPVPQGTKIDWKMMMQPGGFFKLAEPVLLSTLKKDLNANLNKLKELLESGDAPTSQNSSTIQFSGDGVHVH